MYAHSEVLAWIDFMKANYERLCTFGLEVPYLIWGPVGVIAGLLLGVMVRRTLRKHRKQ